MKTITPQLGLESFSCPHCGAIAHQTWFRTALVSYTHDKTKPNIRSANKHVLFTENLHCGMQSHPNLVNASASRCYSCGAFALWIQEQVIHPENSIGITPHDDIPDVIRDDFIEAASIVDKSPRSAAALLRLCIQKMMPLLDVQDSNLNDAIGKLVKKGLDKKIQQALDVVRVVGNNAVHPGEIDLKDDKATALQLFSLINLIVATMISAKKQLDEMYASLPSGALAAIKKRDGE